jgi:RNA polymerase sigma-70 factor, ECF subfamily
LSPAEKLVSAEPSTTALVLAAKAGDNEQFGRLLEQHRGYLLMLGHRYLSDRMRRRIDPADLVQATFLEAKRDWPSFRGSSPGEFTAWLRHILKNNLASAVARHVTTQKRSLNREVSAPAGNSSAGYWIAQQPGNTSTPSGKVVRAEAAAKLLEALHSLPETQAEALRLRYLEGLTLAEIVDRMGKSETAVAGLLKRGLAKLRTTLGKQWEEFSL